MKTSSQIRRASIKSLQVKGVTLHNLHKVHDPRGNLCAAEFVKDVPFRPKRFFVVFDVPKIGERGDHAHKKCDQFLICVQGKMSVRIKDGKDSCSIRLHRLDQGLFVPAGLWCSQRNYSKDGVLLAFTSHHYDAADYIRNYSEYLEWKKRN